MPSAHNGSVEIHYETFGDPSDPALLLINGLGSQCINYRVEWCERFAARGLFVVRFDNRDVGLSTKFDHVAPDLVAVATALARREVPDVPYRLPDMANDAIAVLDALGIERAHVMGVSMGGMIVQQLAIDHPGRLLSLTSVMSTTGDPDVGQPTAEALAVLMAPPATDREGAIERHLAGIRVIGSPGQVDEALHREYAGEAFDRCFNPAGVTRQVMAIMASGVRSEGLRTVKLPALVLHGDADTLVDISGGRRTAACIEGARFVTLEGMGHDYPASYWDRWVDLVADHVGVGAGA